MTGWMGRTFDRKRRLRRALQDLLQRRALHT